MEVDEILHRSVWADKVVEGNCAGMWEHPGSAKERTCDRRGPTEQVNCHSMCPDNSTEYVFVGTWLTEQDTVQKNNQSKFKKQ